MAESNSQIAEKLTIAWRFFCSHGYVDGFGHISARTSDPNRILITPHSLRPDPTPDEFVIVDLEDFEVFDGELLIAVAAGHFFAFVNPARVGSLADGSGSALAVGLTVGSLTA